MRKCKHPCTPGREIIPVTIEYHDGMVLRPVETIDAVLRIDRHRCRRHVPAGGDLGPVLMHFIRIFAAPNHSFDNGHNVPFSACCLSCEFSSPHCTRRGGTVYIGQCVSYWTYASRQVYHRSSKDYRWHSLQQQALHTEEVSHGLSRKNRAGDGSWAGDGTRHRPAVRPG